MRAITGRCFLKTMATPCWRTRNSRCNSRHRKHPRWSPSHRRTATRTLIPRSPSPPRSETAPRRSIRTASSSPSTARRWTPRSPLATKGSTRSPSPATACLWPDPITGSCWNSLMTATRRQANRSRWKSMSPPTWNLSCRRRSILKTSTVSRNSKCRTAGRASISRRKLTRNSSRTISPRPITKAG